MIEVQFVIGLIVGGAVSGIAIAYANRHIADTADWKLRTAQAVRFQAEQMLADAERDAVIARALTTQTAECQVIRPSVRVRVGAVLTDLREWAAGLGPDTSPTWAPGEVLALAEKPPLRKRGQVHPSRRTWPLIEVLPPVETPLQVARRLACLKDPSRTFRIIVVRTS